MKINHFAPNNIKLVFTPQNRQEVAILQLILQIILQKFLDIGQTRFLVLTGAIETLGVRTRLKKKIF